SSARTAAKGGPATVSVASSARARATFRRSGASADQTARARAGKRPRSCAWPTAAQAASASRATAHPREVRGDSVLRVDGLVRLAARDPRGGAPLVVRGGAYFRARFRRQDVGR